ncbi:hypothetical protein [Paenibacillus lutrae]|uniref:Uncharacterized protein n=1 Tax=Paenibacillus lutrae TaxID=2078573 RepID=A0A7X3K0F1_9BACL|nr:hypothetical protein [Paenibacillus lutrae]MVP01103.1 hypothetical protein [Paenibacillus lutrae]
MPEPKKTEQEIEQQTQQKGNRDHPEQYPTEKESLFDMYESQQNVDPIPVEDLNIEQQEEKDKEGTKHNSSSPDKYHSGF